MPSPTRPHRWLAGHALAGGLGTLLTTAAGAGVGRLAGEAPAPGAMVLAMILVGGLEGALYGAVQGQLLGRGTQLVARTALAFGLAWAAGALFSALEPDGALPRSALLATAAVAGAGFGALVGTVQARAFAAAGPWTLHSIAGWAAAFVVGAVSSDLLPLGLIGARGLAQSAFGGALGGVVLGAVLLPARSRARS
ncbi:MAG: hypothetical protein AAF447_28400 [Myxococcota bacterium]